MLIVNDRIHVPLKELQFTFSASSGPGGQNVNKVASKATLRWAVKQSSALPPEVRERFLQQNPRRITNEGDLLISSQRFRDQGRNVADCLEKLRELLRQAAVRPVKRKATKPTKGSQVRRLEDKRKRAQTKERRRRLPED